MIIAATFDVVVTWQTSGQALTIPTSLDFVDFLTYISTAVIVVGTFFVEIETSRFWAVVITRRNHDIVRVGAVVVLVGFHKQIPMVNADT